MLNLELFWPDSFSIKGPFKVAKRLGTNYYFIEKDSKLITVNLRQMCPYSSPDHENKIYETIDQNLTQDLSESVFESNINKTRLIFDKFAAALAKLV